MKQENIKPLAANYTIHLPKEEGKEFTYLKSFAYQMVGANSIKFYGDFVGETIKTDAALTVITKEALKDVRDFFTATWENWQLEEKAWPVK